MICHPCLLFFFFLKPVTDRARRMNAPNGSGSNQLTSTLACFHLEFWFFFKFPIFASHKKEQGQQWDRLKMPYTHQSDIAEGNLVMGFARHALFLYWLSNWWDYVSFISFMSSLSDDRHQIMFWELNEIIQTKKKIVPCLPFNTLAKFNISKMEIIPISLIWQKYIKWYKIFGGIILMQVIKNSTQIILLPRNPVFVSASLFF